MMGRKRRQVISGRRFGLFKKVFRSTFPIVKYMFAHSFSYPTSVIFVYGKIY
jgi:hypothetical protein